jgi:EAL domain-containing protein (putative c-di-GMP-specific phosphodiesterase class I)
MVAYDRGHGGGSVSQDSSTRWILWERPKPEVVASTTTERPAPGTSAPGTDTADATPVRRVDLPAAAQRPTLPPAPATQRTERAASGMTSHPGARGLSAQAHALIAQIVAERDVTVEYQPVLDVRRGQVVGFEALSRGPDGPLRTPDRLFAAATAAGLGGQLDWICRATAFRQMLTQNLPPSISLFVNVEADSLIEPCPEDLLETVWQATAKLRVFIDIAGRTVTRYPAEALETVRRARAAGWGVAVGDFEFSPRAQSMLPTLEPDVLKVNHRVLTVASAEAGAAISALLSEAEHTGAAVMLERVEDAAAMRVGRCVGAVFQIGRLFGMPGGLPAGLPLPLSPVPLRTSGPPVAESPWDLVASHAGQVANGVRAAEVTPVLRALVAQATPAAAPPVIAALIPDWPGLDQDHRLVFQMLMECCPLVLIVGGSVSALNDWHIRAADLPEDHPFRTGQFCLAALSPTLAMAMATKPADRTGDTLDVAVTHDPTVCRQVTRDLIGVADTLEGGVRHIEA